MLTHTIKTIVPNKKEIDIAQHLSKTLASYLKSSHTQTIQLFKKNGRKKEAVLFPIIALKLFIAALKHMGEGKSITLIPGEPELTTQEAANLLNVSRPHLVKLLEEGKIPHHKVGTKRRVLAKDIMMYKNKIDKLRVKTLETLTKQAQDLNMGY